VRVYHERLKWLEAEEESPLFYRVSTASQSGFWIPKADFSEPPAPMEKKRRVPKKEEQDQGLCRS
jgi:hypothetical protein